MYVLSDINSSIISYIEYNEDKEELHIEFQPTYYIKYATYIKVPKNYFDALTESSSFGKFYLEMIKPNFLTKTQSHMALTKKAQASEPPPAPEKKKPQGINRASNKQRFIKMNICVTKMNREWFFFAESGEIYANVTLFLKPDGEVDRYGNLGMIVQDVPKSVYDLDKSIQGPILGNGAEYDWTPQAVRPGEQSGELLGARAASVDDLPF